MPPLHFTALSSGVKTNTCPSPFQPLKCTLKIVYGSFLTFEPKAVTILARMHGPHISASHCTKHHLKAPHHVSKILFEFVEKFLLCVNFI